MVPIDLKRFLGLRGYYGGVSYDTYKCAAPINVAFPKMSNDTFTMLSARLTKVRPGGRA